MTERISETRNSPLRQIIAPLTEGLARGIYKRASWISPTMINFVGTGLVFVGSIIANKHPRWATFFIGTGSGMDGIDGSLAREIDRNIPGSVNFEQGAIFDTLGDKIQELILALSRGKVARNKGDSLGEKLALTSAITNPLPSTFRAYSEFCGNDVPESGNGIFGLIGTRPGRAVLGTIATVVPEFKGFPVQPVLDTLITASNIKTSFDRLRIALKGTDKLLPEKVRQEAQVRLIALGLFGITAAGSLAAYFILNRKEDSALEETHKLEKRRYLEILGQIEQYCQEMGLNHRFVGGTFTDFIGPNTEFKIDTEIKRIQLIHSNGSTMTRTDKTIKDVDLVVFNPDRNKFLEAKEEFRSWRLEAQKNGLPYPNISAEAAWHPGWPERKKLGQMVSVFEFDENGQPYLVFGSIKQPISPESLDPWEVIIEDGASITTFNPIGHLECYHLRNPSGIKKKDTEPIGSYDGAGKKPYSKLDLLERLSEEVAEEGKKRGVDFEKIFNDWIVYARALQHDPDLLIRSKAVMLRAYWATIGTPLAHGVGLLRGLSTLSNRFTG